MKKRAYVINRSLAHKYVTITDKKDGVLENQATAENYGIGSAGLSEVV